MVRRVGARFLLVVVAISGGLLLVEVAFRVGWMKSLVIGAGIEHPHFHHRLAPQTAYRYASAEFDVTVHTNRYGLRGPDPVIPKPPGVIRLLMLGDSYTFGFPVRDEDTFCSLIEGALRAQGDPVEVINGGVSGYSPTLHYVSLRDQYLAFEPDLVVLWYDLGDLQEDAWFQKNVVRHTSGEILRVDPRYTNGRVDLWEWLKRYSALVKYLDVKVLRTVSKIRTLGLGGYLTAKLRGERAKVAIARLKAQQRAPDLASHDRFLLVRDTSSESFLQPYWEVSAGYVRRIRELLDARGIPFALGIYPYGMLVGPNEWGEGRVFWGFERGKVYEASAALSLFQRFAETEGIPLINTFESFRAAEAAGPLFYAQDGHFTPAGHQVLATHVVHDPVFLRLLRRHLARRLP